MRNLDLLRTALAAALVASCSIEGSLGPVAALELVRAERTWERQHLRDYDYEYRKSCFCEFDGTLIVRVRAGVVTSATRVMDGSALTDEELAQVPTILGLFGIARRALDDADEVTVEYHPTLGFPTRIAIDWLEDAVDDEVVYTAGSLDPVP